MSLEDAGAARGVCYRARCVQQLAAGPQRGRGEAPESANGRQAYAVGQSACASFLAVTSNSRWGSLAGQASGEHDASVRAREPSAMIRTLATTTVQENASPRILESEMVNASMLHRLSRLCGLFMVWSGSQNLGAQIEGAPQMKEAATNEARGMGNRRTCLGAFGLGLLPR
eukprot:9376322-Alexandrium_andersonii.AAC.2